MAAAASSSAPTGLSAPVYALCLATGLVGSVGVLFHAQLTSGFSTLFGEPFDGVIEAVLIGHWHKVARLQQAWNDAGLFYPYPDTIGYNDAYFLYGLISLPFRAAGLDLLRTQEAVHVCVRAIGFLSMAALLRALLGRRCVAGLFGACLFTLMLNASHQAVHGQLLTVSFAPLFFWFVWRLWVAADMQLRLAWAFAAALLLAALMVTSFYMAWFLGLFCALLAASLAAADPARAKRGLAAALGRWRVLRTWRGGLTLAACVACFIPFLAIYLPKLRETHGHAYAAALFYAPWPTDLLNIGPGSLLWGSLFTRAAAAAPGIFRDGEFEVGFTPDILVGLLATVWLRGWLTPVQRAILIATAAALVLPMSVHGVSVWWLVFRLVPGASGVRTISRLWLFLGVPISILLAVLVDALLLRTRLVGIGAALCMLLSQVDLSPPTGLVVSRTLAPLATLPAPPSGCGSFYVTGGVDPAQAADVGYGLYQDNVLAMLIADRIGLPTINGFATFLPKDWNFAAFPQETYANRVMTYATAHSLVGVCGYDVSKQSFFEGKDQKTFIP